MKIIKIIIILKICTLGLLIFAENNIQSTIKNQLILYENTSVPQHVFNTFSNEVILLNQFSTLISANYDLSEKLSIIIYNPEIFISLNTLRPFSYNDGAMWQGRGINTKTTIGFELRSPRISFRLYPNFWMAQNADIDIISAESSSGYGDYWKIYDHLQRYGDSEYSEFNWGKSDIRFHYNNLTIGISNENITLGPGVKNNIILGSQGSGFPHIDFGTIGLIPILNIGIFEYRGVYGILEESEFFDDDNSNNYGWISGSTFGFSPNNLKALTLGFNYYYTKPLESLDKLDSVRLIPGLDKSNSAIDLKDVMVSATFNLDYDSVGFKLYGELARNDAFGSMNDLWRQPEHTSAYTIGFSQSIYKTVNCSLSLAGELTNLEQTRTQELRAAGPWYRHDWAGWEQGYSNKGQLLGSTIGPGSNSQWIKLQYIKNKKMLSISFQRIAHDKDYYYKLFKEQFSETGILKQGDTLRQYTEAIISIDAMYLIKNYSIYGQIAYNPHMYYAFKNVPTINNIHLELGISYNLN